MSSTEQMKSSFIHALQASQREKAPYAHWLLSGIFPEDVIDGILDLPISAPRMDYAEGKRDANNDKRGYFDVERREEFPVCDKVAETLQSPEVISAIEQECGVNLEGTYLRIEFTQDSPGFWLEPHTDIGVKKFTMLIYLSRDEDAKNWGTSIYTSSDPQSMVGNAPFEANHGLIFIPATDTWHGYAERPMAGVRKSLIVNYVGDEWRARHELAFPEAPIHHAA